MAIRLSRQRNAWQPGYELDGKTMLKKLLEVVGLSKARMVNPPAPKRIESFEGYKASFEQACRFTKQLGFAAPDVKWIDGDVLADDGEFILRTAEAAQLSDFSYSAAQCLKWCHYLRPYFEQVLDVPVWLTVGQLWNEDRAVFHPSWDELRKWSGEGIRPSELIAQGRDGIDIHAWLTVASGEIIEPTLLSSLAKIRPEEEGDKRGAVMWGRPPQMHPQFRHVPMAVGTPFAEGLNRNPMFPLLAQNREDLALVPVYQGRVIHVLEL